ncbi:MAG: leucine-rich repeat domain-containing protein [Clostridia bacterium]|nr:leucine-rich repeat domain-containing protein [Clostridia bacterium]
MRSVNWLKTCVVIVFLFALSSCKAAECEHVVRTVPSVAPTCTKDGATAYSDCSVCGMRITEPSVIPATGHVPTVAEPSVPTCTENGNSGETKCTVCGEVLSEGTVIPATGHEFATVHGKAPTCTEQGTADVEKCVRCGFEKTEGDPVIPPLGHTAVIKQGVAPDCTNDGKTDGSECSVCGAVLKVQEVIPATGHRAVEVPAVAATCTLEGKTAGSSCGDCGAVLIEQRSVPVTEHSYGEYKVEKPHTCTEKGLVSASCSVCGHKQTLETEAKGHSFGVYSVVSAATCSTDAVEAAECSDCGERITRTVAGSALGHTEVKDEARPATCKEAGLTEGNHCSSCGVVLVAQKEIARTLHTVENGQCTGCGGKEGTKGLQYKILDNGTECVVTGLGSMLISDLTIGEVYGQYTVVGVEKEAFKKNETLYRVKLGSNLRYIGLQAFWGCKSLTFVEGGEALEEIRVSAFSGCSSLRQFDLPESLLTLQNSAFANCPLLERIYIPKNLAKVSGNTFVGSAEGCRAIEVDPQNRYYTVIDGHLYSKDGSHLVLMAPNWSGDVFRIPESVTRVGHNAIRTARPGQRIWLHEGIKVYEDGAFSGAKNYFGGEIYDDAIYLGMGTEKHAVIVGVLWKDDFELKIPLSTKLILNVGQPSEGLSDALKEKLEDRGTEIKKIRGTVVYEGTLEQWKALDKPAWFENYFTAIKCSDGTVDLSKNKVED